MTQADLNSAGARRPAPDEIDLVGLFVGLVRFFSRNLFLLGMGTLFGLGAGSGFYFLKKPVYKSRLTAECMSLPDGRTVELIQDLDKLRENEDWVQLGRLLGLKPGEAALIRKIEPFSNVAIDKVSKGIDDYLLATTATAYSFSVEVKVKSRNDLWPKIQQGIIRFLSENPYSKVRVSRFIENRKNLVSSLGKEIQKLDSLNLLFAGKIIGDKSSSTLTSPGDYKAIVVNMIERKLAAEDELRFAEPVRVIQPFMIFRNPVEPVLSTSLLLFVAVGWAIAGIIILIRSLIRVYQSNRSAYPE